MRESYVQKAISRSHYEDIMSSFETSRKLQDIKHSDFFKFTILL